MSRSPITMRLIGLTVLATTAMLLSACSTHGGESPDARTPTPKPSPQAVAYNECTDGATQVSVKASADPVAVAACDGVNIITSDQSYEIASVKVLTVEASNATIHIAQPGVQTVAVLGSGNAVTYTGTPPQIDDQGEGNSVVAG
jgi:hypothetical protein